MNQMNDQVWLKDVEYKNGDKKKCKSLDEYFRLPPKKLSIAKKPITRQICRHESGECAIFG
jgi:hypothetical protein